MRPLYRCLALAPPLSSVSSLHANMLLQSCSDLCAELVLGIDWVSAIQPLISENIILDPAPDHLFPAGHIWISQFCGMFPSSSSSNVGLIHSFSDVAAHNSLLISALQPTFSMPVTAASSPYLAESPLSVA